MYQKMTHTLEDLKKLAAVELRDVNREELVDMQAAGIGNNLNQIARYFHGGGLASRGMLEELKKCIAEIRELRQEVVQLGGAYRGDSKTHRK